MEIKEYLEKIKNFKKNFQINFDNCEEHNEKYKSYCLDCNEHLCEKCQKFGTHIGHYKINIIEIEPIPEELKIIENIIDYYTNWIDNLKRKNITLSKRVKEILNNEEKKIIKIKNQKIIKLNDKKENDLEKNKNEYLKDIKLMKEKYEKEIKIRKDIYQVKKNNIINEYNLSKEKINFICSNKEEMLKKMIKDKFNYFNLREKIEKLNNIKKLNELIYDTYNNYNYNFYNSININHLVIHYYNNNDHIKNNIIKNILKDDFTNKIKLIIRKNQIFKKESNKTRPQFNDEDNRINIKNEENEKNLEGKDLKVQNFNDEDEDNKSNLNLSSFKKKSNFDLLNREPEKIIRLSLSDFQPNIDLFPIFNNIFFLNKEQTRINDKIIDDIYVKNLKDIYIKYMKEEKANILINYFDCFIKNNVLQIFRKKELEQQPILNIIRQNIEKILECFGMNSNTYHKYYFLERETPKKKWREPTGFFQRFRVDENKINYEEELLKKLDKNNDDMYKIFKQMFG